MFFIKSKIGQKLMLLAMILPALLFIVGTYGAGFLLSLLQSLTYMPLLGDYDLSLEVYTKLFETPEFYRSLGFSLWVSLISTAIAAVVGVLLALWIRRRSKAEALFTWVLQLNLPIPHLVGAVAIMMLLSQSGLAARLATALGMIEQPSQFPVLVTDPYGIGIIIEYIWKEIPFVAITVLSILQSWLSPYEKQLQVLGASRWQRFRYVTLPFILPAVISSSVVIFTYTFGSYEVPYVLGMLSQPTLSVLAYQAYVTPDVTYRATAMAINTVITLLSSLFILIYLRWGESFRAEA